MSHQRWVLVTGGAKRLGREFCLAFARAGWGVVCHYHRSESEAQHTREELLALNVPCVLVQGDLSDEDAPEQLLAQCETTISTLPHCIVNSASIFEEDQALSNSVQLLKQHFAVNTAFPLLLGNLWARKVQSMGVSSDDISRCLIHVLDQKVHNLNPDYFSYTVSKLALWQSVGLQAQGLAPHVRVCGLSPGLLYTSGPQSQDNFDAAKTINLMRRPIAPADVAKSALFLAENAGINGCTLQCDNGQHLLGLSRDVMFAIEEKTAP